MQLSNNKLIAKNTIVLSAQMLIGLIVGLYTGRIVLSTLGVVDYGIYNVVGGVITTLTFLTNALSAGSNRFITYELGKGDIQALKRTVSNIMTVHFTLAGIVLLLAETIGLWFVSTQLVIPAERMFAAMWVYQFSILSFIIGIISAPYNGMLFAHERLTIYAYFNLINLVLKLLIVYIIAVAPFDRLVFYAFLLLCVDIGNRLIYGIYCNRHFEESKSGFSFNKAQYKEILSFSGWMSIGNIASVCSNQGLNILLNIFFGPIVNAAYGIAMMIEGQVMAYGVQFQVSMRPQIIKSYAEGDQARLQSLIFAGAKFSYFITFAIALPVMMEIDQFLNWWLVEVPAWTLDFVLIIICISLIQVIGVSLYGGNLATGKVRTYQLIQSVTMISFLPVTYIMLKFMGISPVAPFVLLLSFNVISAVAVAIITLRQLAIPILLYFRSVILPILKVSLTASVAPVMLRMIMDVNVWSFFVICIVSLCSVLFSSYLLGCNENEKIVTRNWCVSKYHCLRNR